MNLQKFYMNFLKCGVMGWCLEVLFTSTESIINHDWRLMGRTSLLMFPIYGMGALLEPIGRAVDRWLDEYDLKALGGRVQGILPGSRRRGRQWGKPMRTIATAGATAQLSVASTGQQTLQGLSCAVVPASEGAVAISTWEQHSAPANQPTSVSESVRLSMPVTATERLIRHGFLYMTLIFATEYVAGGLLRSLGMCPWDYSGRHSNINGLIRLDFAPLWFATGLLFELITKKREKTVG